jgi:hypothetical protein
MPTPRWMAPAGAPRFRDDRAARQARSSWVGGVSSRLLQACAGSAVELANSLADTPLRSAWTDLD